MTAARMESHHIWSNPGIWEKMISVAPKAIMYALLDTWHRPSWPLRWKQSALLIALLVDRDHNGSKPGRQWSCRPFDPIPTAEMYTHIMLIDAAMVYPIATPNMFTYWIQPQTFTFIPPKPSSKSCINLTKY